MLRFLLRRLASSVAVLVAASLLAHFLIYLAPGDPAAMIVRSRIGRIPTPEEVARVSFKYGLDRPPLLQYAAWAGRAVRGDLGYSIRTDTPVVKEIGTRIGVTILLAAITTLFTIVVGIPSGLIAAQKFNSLWDRISCIVALIGVSIPNFWLAFLLILVFSVNLGWLPTYGFRGIEYLILPVVSLGLAHAARLSRFTRSTLLQVRGQNYLQTARAKGFSEQAVWLRHALPNVAVPLLTMVADQFSHIIAGSVIVETLFSLPGIGNYFVIAVKFRDLPALQALVLLFAFVFVSINTLTDIAYTLIDPRIRLE